jgi:ubiquinone/menaquinone biosynthesis C-methylase UbiE
MAMDVYIHPITHMLYHYLKRKDYDEFINEIENSKKYFMEYSNNNINAYYFGYLFENIKEKNEILNELKCIIENKGNDLVEEIIKINMK